MANATAALQVYQLRIGLRHLRPPIWRRVLVPNVMTLEELHTTIQLAMGWENAHLHEFIVNRQSYGDPTWDEIGDMLSESKVRLADLGLDVGSQFEYIYDFGDDWRHLVKVEEIMPYDQAAFYPVCLKAVRACPPEDVGGPYGYAEFLDALADADHPDHESVEEWIGDEFDPKQVDLGEINADLEALFYQKRWTSRKL